jgi:hypothetical protein
VSSPIRDLLVQPLSFDSLGSLSHECAKFFTGRCMSKHLSVAVRFSIVAGLLNVTAQYPRQMPPDGTNLDA